MNFNLDHRKANAIIAAAEKSASDYVAANKIEGEDARMTDAVRNGYEIGSLRYQVRSLIANYEMQLNAPQTSHAVTSYKTGKTEYEIHFDVIENYGPEVVFHGVYVNASDVQNDLSESVLDAMQAHCYKVADEMLEESKVGVL